VRKGRKVKHKGEAENASQVASARPASSTELLSVFSRSRSRMLEHHGSAPRARGDAALKRIHASSFGLETLCLLIGQAKYRPRMLPSR
jgi:hypothetical protein